MSLLNYTTTVRARRSQAEILLALKAAGAVGVNIDKTSVAFRLAGEFVRLEVCVAGAHSLIKGNRRVAKSLRTQAQAERVAWRTVAGWVKHQVALMQMAAVQPEKLAPKPAWMPPSALAALVSVQRRAQLEWGERLE